VSTANGGVDEIIFPETGLIVPIKNSIALADSISLIFKHYSNYDSKIIRELALKVIGRGIFKKLMIQFYGI
jgi:hypothetical protein